MAGVSPAMLLALAGVWAVGLASPGPDFFLIANRGFAKGFRHAVAAAAGVVAGIEIWIIASLVGLGTVLREFPQARAALSVLGGVYLLWLGLQSARAGGSRAWTEDAASEAAASRRHTDFLAGLLTNLGNPKALIFFGALLVRFVPAGSGPLAQFEVWSMMTVMACAWFGALAMLVSRKSLQGWLSARIHVVNYATGAVFLVLGAVMVYEGFCPPA